MLKLRISPKHLRERHGIDVAPTELSLIFLARSYKDIAPTERLRSHPLVTFSDWEHKIRSGRSRR
jgi:hypothetical protein